MKKIVLFISSLLFFISVYAGVNIPYGNFYVAYTDFVLFDSVWKDIEIIRTYNSITPYNGVFGYGWGSEIETYLQASPDNSILIAHNGSGKRYRFESEMTNEESIQKEIELIISASYKTKKIDTPEEEIELRNELVSNSGIRFSYYERYRKTGYIDTIYHDPGVTFFSQACGCIGEYKPGYSYVISTEYGYDYYDYTHDNSILSFNKQGKLVKVTSIENPDWYYILSYEDGNKISRLDTYNGHWLTFKTDSLNRITEINCNDTSKKAIYEYKDKGLAYSKDMGNHEYGYEYNKNYNMTKIIYNLNRKDGEHEDSYKIYYTEKNQYASKVIERNGSYTTYEYLGNSDMESGTDIKEYDKNDTLTNSRSQWWFLKTNDHGHVWTYKTIKVENNDSTIRIFHEISRKPIEIKTSSGIYKYNYSPTGYLLEGRDSENNKATFVYDSENNITDIIFKESKYKLLKEEDAFKYVIFPDGMKYEIPVNIEETKIESEFEDSFFQLKTLLDMCYYQIFN